MYLDCWISLSGPYLYKGFSGKAELANSSFNELDDHHHLGHVDAALRMHYRDDPTHHDHIFLFLVKLNDEEKSNSLWEHYDSFASRRHLDEP